MITLTLEYWQDDGWYVGRVREIPDCFSQGGTLEELERNIAEVYKLLQNDVDLPTPARVRTKPLQLPA